MQIQNLPTLLEMINQLIDQCQSTAPEKLSIVTGPREADVENLLEFGVYPPTDRTSVPRRALLAIGQTLGAVGGIDLMKQVFDAYKAKHGPRRAAKLSKRWDTAAGIWYD
ncbi:hypothetical protein QQS45_11920 [Alteriqipengyuania flavescens]|uniref:hypothetical protein n=1 Tax=Alteriqipengyuania flavescens TaxID=3053610 RepID=UPI0025B4B15B|nr:hypothetical protein [Alteriqipengyuania flavescens]WJY18318.1 hypothetical protein QQW98_11915 [Alteriqipengyuania flavescens]WJY24259.1 hypothetical protein QQS45_11920 [Alteriqipengyuania flavescens]